MLSENGLYFLCIVTAGIDSLFPPAGGIRYFPMLPLGDFPSQPTPPIFGSPQLDKMDPASTVTFNDGVLASSWPTASARNAWL